MMLNSNERLEAINLSTMEEREVRSILFSTSSSKSVDDGDNEQFLVRYNNRSLGEIQ